MVSDMFSIDPLLHQSILLLANPHHLRSLVEHVLGCESTLPIIGQCFLLRSRVALKHLNTQRLSIEHGRHSSRNRVLVNFCNRLWGTWLWFGDITVRSELNWTIYFEKNIVLKLFPKVKLPGEWNCTWSISTSATFVVRERPTHTRSWNLKAALGPKPCKVNQQYFNIPTLLSMCSPKGFLAILIRIKFVFF